MHNTAVRLHTHINHYRHSFLQHLKQMATNPTFSLQHLFADDLARIYYVLHHMPIDVVKEATDNELIESIRTDLHLDSKSNLRTIKNKLIPRLIRRLRKMQYNGSYTYDDIINFIFVHRPPRPPAPYTPPPTPHITTIGDNPEDVRKRLRPRPFPLDPPSPPRPLPRYIDSNEYKERQLRKRIDQYRQRQGRLKRTLSSEDLRDTHQRPQTSSTPSTSSTRTVKRSDTSHVTDHHHHLDSMSTKRRSSRSTKLTTWKVYYNCCPPYNTSTTNARRPTMKVNHTHHTI